MADLTPKVALITGASSGIGRATARLFAERGARVVVAARRKERLQDVVDEIAETGGEASAIQTDVSVAADVKAMVAHAVDTYGRLDICVNNAGIEGDELVPIFEMSEEAWSRVMDVNVKGNWLCLKYQAQAMLAAGNGGAIVNVGSVNSFLGFAGGTAYATSKHAQVGLNASAAAELTPHGIRVNLVCPGFVKTEMHQRLRAVVSDEAVDGMIENVPMGRASEAEEQAQAILWLCSDEASYVSGTTLTPDGGAMASMG